MRKIIKVDNDSSIDQHHKKVPICLQMEQIRQKLSSTIIQLVLKKNWQMVTCLTTPWPTLWRKKKRGDKHSGPCRLEEDSNHSIYQGSMVHALMMMMRHREVVILLF